MGRYRRPSYNETVIIYTDGCALRNGKRNAKGGGAIVYRSEGFKDRLFFYEFGPQTNNRYELEAIKEAMRRSLMGGGVYDVIIRTDSHYAINALTVWIDKWIQNDWTTCQGKRVQNADLIQTITSMISNMNRRGGSVDIQYVQAHCGDHFNEQADRMAKQAAKMNPLFDY